MATVSSLSNNDDDASSLHQLPKQRMPSITHNTAKTPDNFVLGNRHGTSNRNDDNRYTTTNFQRANENGYDIELLKHLSNDFAQLLNRTDISDCLLNVRGTYMAVHRCVLAARSSTFAAVISDNINRLDTTTRDQLKTLVEKNKLVITIDKTDAETMKQVVVFLYTSKCELNERNAYALLDAAGRYDIKSLKVHTGRYLAHHINTNNILMLIKAAYKYDNVLVKQKCIEYFIDHAKDIMDINELWKVFAEEYPPIVAELLYWSVNKEEFRKTIPQSDSYSQW
ncbi:unnamed protein product [Adineta steineri]|uniref:BTB domain-containing protein n=1 Tax=Adineta steineri TaxID=433720 RepID=A0A813Y9P1_9BILA|nr:unnamed protein product [Adineta steineri]CAF0886987.1 unnamed protein product [Adineta steineri]